MPYNVWAVSLSPRNRFDMITLDILRGGRFQVVKPLLQERTKRKIQVLEGCGRDELLKVYNMSMQNYYRGS